MDKARELVGDVKEHARGLDGYGYTIFTTRCLCQSHFFTLL